MTKHNRNDKFILAIFEEQQAKTIMTKPKNCFSQDPFAMLVEQNGFVIGVDAATFQQPGSEQHCKFSHL